MAVTYAQQKPADREYIKNLLIQMYYQINNDTDVIDLESKASELEEPFVTDFKNEIKRYAMSHSGNGKTNQVRTAAEISEVEDIEELEEDIVDIEVLDEIEGMVIRTLQYLNLELYDSDKIKDFITNIAFDNFEKQGLSWSMKDRIKNVIQNIVEHEFRELDNKRKFRRETLVNSANEFFSQAVNMLIEENRDKRKGKLTKFQKKNLQKFIYATIIANNIDEFKKRHKLNYEELKFVDHIFRLIIQKQLANEK